MLNINKQELPENVQESDVLVLKDGKYIIDEEKRREIEARIQEKLKNLFSD